MIKTNPGRFVGIEVLEGRQLLSAVTPSSYEVYLVELINRARANPTAEATRYGIDLNEGLAPGTISTAAKQPLAINRYLTNGARKHSVWMLDNDTFSHTGVNGSNPQARMSSAGYAFTGSWNWGENIAWGSYNLSASSVATLEKLLFVDKGIEGRGHRTNLMSNSFREIGGGIAEGEFRGWSSTMMTQDFAASGSGAFLCGVAYKDTVKRDSFYTPGEGLRSITVRATRLSDSRIFSTTTGSTGAYSLKLPAGTYKVTGTGTALGRTVTFGSVTISTRNVKRDFKAATTTTAATPRLMLAPRQAFAPASTRSDPADEVLA